MHWFVYWGLGHLCEITLSNGYVCPSFPRSVAPLAWKLPWMPEMNSVAMFYPLEETHSFGPDFWYWGLGQGHSVWNFRMRHFLIAISFNFNEIDSRFQYVLPSCAAPQLVGARFQNFFLSSQRSFDSEIVKIPDILIHIIVLFFWQFRWNWAFVSIFNYESIMASITYTYYT